jgi:pyruvate kinase
MGARQRGVQIICTIGPASFEPRVLEGLIDAGMSVARINFAHGEPDQHREAVARIRAASEARGRPVGILQDLPGPKIRLGELAEGWVELRSGDVLSLDCGSQKGDATRLPVPDTYLPQEVRPQSLILLGDGAVELEVIEVKNLEIRCKVTVGGPVASGKGVNAAGGVSDRPLLDERDRAALELGAELEVDFVGVSFVRTGDDLRSVRRVLRSLGRPAPLVAKIETAVALDHLDDILARTDAVMIARGDLSLEVPYERVPMEQKRIVRAALRAGRPVITATQMLQSMVTAPRPTRAEATDVANAVLDGTDAVMLSDETAIGVDPIRCCRTMARLIEGTEAASERDGAPEEVQSTPDLHELMVFARAAARTARDVGARGIMVWTRGGVAARLLSQQRPNVPIIAPTRFEDSYRKLTLPFGIRPVFVPRGKLSRTQLETQLGPLVDTDLLVVVRHLPGDRRRIPFVGLVRVSDEDEWSIDLGGR